MYSSLEPFKGLSEEDAAKAYRHAVMSMKRSDPYVFLKMIMCAGAGGAAGVAAGVFFKDMIFKIQGINFYSLALLALCAAMGGAAGGIIASIRLRRKLEPFMVEARKELDL